MKKVVIISIIGLIGVVGIFFGIRYFHSLSKLNKSFSIYVEEDVNFILKTDNLNLLKNHVRNSVLNNSLDGVKEFDLALNRLMSVDSVMKHYQVPFEFYNTLKYYCMVRENGQSYVVIESPYQIDVSQFLGYFNIKNDSKENQNIYTFLNQHLFLKGRFAVVSDNLEGLENIEKGKPISEIDQLSNSRISDTYCQIYQKKENWITYDVLIQDKYVQMPHVYKLEEEESFGAVEDKEIFYFIPQNVDHLEIVKSKSLFKEIVSLYGNNVELSTELTNWVNGSVAKFETPSGSYFLARTMSDIAPAAQLESATLMNLNITADSLEHFKVNEHVVLQFDPSKNYNEIFGSETEYKWYTELSNYVLFADSRTAMTNYFDAFDAGELINFDSDFSAFVQSFPSASNHFVLTKEVDSISYPGTFNADGAVMAKSTSYSNKLKFENVGYFFTESFKTGSSESMVAMETEISMNVDKLIPIPDHIDGGFSFLLSSNNGELLFLNKDGKEKWKAKVEGRILGEPAIIDLFGNNKKQIVFNTKTKLYLLDIKGNTVSGFPYVISGGASNAVSVLDYDKNNNYRFFIATKENKILNIGEDGKPVQGWEFSKTDGPVNGEIAHFIISGKDYIFFSDKTGKVYLLNRRGQLRVEEEIKGNRPYHYFQKGKDLLSTRLFAVTSEKIYTLNLDQQIDSIEMEISKPYQFIGFKDYNNDGLKEFIFASKGYVNIVNQFGLISRQIPSPAENVSKVELIYRNSKLENVVVFDYVKEELYQLDISGNIVQGYPVKCKKFLGSFQNSKNIVNCVVENNYLRLVAN